MGVLWKKKEVFAKGICFKKYFWIFMSDVYSDVFLRCYGTLSIMVIGSAEKV